MMHRTLRLLSFRQCLYPLLRLNLHTNSCPVLWSYDKDFPNPSLPTPLSKVYSHDTDILLDQLRKAKSVERIIELAEKHMNVMNNNHLVTLMENLHDLVKGDSNAHELLKENVIFQSLCGRLMQGIRHLDSQDLIIIFKLLACIGVRPNTYVMQSVLKMIGAHLNDMNLGQLIFLSFLLSKQKHNALVNGLRLALPLVLQVQIDQQLDSDNMTEIVNCLQLACRSRLKPATIEKILAVILNKGAILSVDDAVTVVFALLNLETPVSGYREVLTSSFDVVSKNAELISESKLLSIIRLCRNQGYYHSAFFFKVAERIVSEKWNFGFTYESLNHFCKLSFCPSTLMDHFVDSICANAAILRINSDYAPLNCAEYLTTTGYKPRNIDNALQVLCSCVEKVEPLREKSPLLFIKFLSCLSMYGHFPENLFKNVDEEYLFSAWSLSKKQGRVAEFERFILSILWSLQVYDKTEFFKFPSILLKKLIHSASQRFINVECPLTKFIENGLGGSQFLKSHVFTQDGHVIDHVLAMRSGNYPVSLQSNTPSSGENVPKTPVWIEDIVLPDDAKFVAVIVASEEQFCKDPEILRGWMDLKVRSLAKKKYSPVVINYRTWRELPDREKIPYLMRGIKEAVRDENVMRNTFLS